LSQPSELTQQQRLEELEELADILLCIYGELSPDQQANQMLRVAKQEAA
jgi:hypothetical protein